MEYIDTQFSHIDGSYTADSPIDGSYTADSPIDGSYTADSPIEGSYTADSPIEGRYTADSPINGSHIDDGSPYYIWDDLEKFEANKETLVNFLINKLYLKRTEKLYEILSIEGNNIFYELKKYHRYKNNESPIVKPPVIESIGDIENYGWSIYDAKYISFCRNSSEPKISKTLQDIGIDILLYIKFQFKKFGYLNIMESYIDGDAKYKCKLYYDICETLSLNDEKMYNVTQQKLLLMKLYNKISFITISNICRFTQLHKMIKKIYQILEIGGYLLIKDFDIVSEDEKCLHNTFYALYRIIFDNVSVEFEKKSHLYMTSVEYIELFSTYGFEIVAKNTPIPTRWKFNDVYLLFIKVAKSRVARVASGKVATSQVCN